MKSKTNHVQNGVVNIKSVFEFVWSVIKLFFALILETIRASPALFAFSIILSYALIKNLGRKLIHAKTT